MIDIRPGTDADRPRVIESVSEVFGDAAAQRAARYWDWQWQLDPRLPAPGYRGIVAEWDGRIIGNLATQPAGLSIAGRAVTAWWTVDALVHWGLTRQALRASRKQGGPRDARLSGGIAAALFDHPGAGPIQLAKHISDPMMAILERIGFEPQAETGSRHRRVSTRHLIGRALGTGLGDLGGRLADLALPRIPAPRLAVHPLTGGFDPRFDDLWDRLRAAYPAICRRDAALLNWRYGQHPDQDYSTLILESEDGLRGYVVIKDFERKRRRRGRLVDLAHLPGDDPAIDALLAAALGELRRRRVERVECFASGAEVMRALSRIGFRPRLTKSGRVQPLMVRRLPDPRPEVQVTLGDGDGG
jgi:hypothetical protein